MKASPVRMCVACHQRKSKDQLLRIVIDCDGIHIDNRGTKFKKFGRGVYICKEMHCIDLTIKKKKLNKYLSKCGNDNCNIVNLYSDIKVEIEKFL